ncbi:MAG: hypothetical protein M5U26_19930 [Planctomycetota bacterium]|nr:hypothetical protein [Planctomycetota bacterium]
MIQHQEWAAGALRGTLARARRIWRASEGLARGLAWLGAALVALLLLAFADHLFDLPGWLRLGLGLGYAAAVFAALAAWVLRPIFWRINDQAAAVYLEGKLGARDNLLINAVQLQAFAREEQPRIGSAAMIRRIVGEASSRAATLKLGALWERRRLRNLCVLAGAALLALFALAAGFPEHAANALERFTRPLSGVPLLARTRVLAWPEHSVEVLSGERLTVHGTAYVPDGAAPREMALLAELPEGTRRIPMSAAPAAHPELPAPAGLPAASFVYEFPNVNASFRFTLASDDGRSRPCEVRVRAKPRVKDVELELQPPCIRACRRARSPRPAA